MTGKSGADVFVKVPQGTLIRDAETGRILADMVDPGEKKVIAKGGKGGLGNMHFATSTRQIPNFARSRGGRKGNGIAAGTEAPCGCRTGRLSPMSENQRCCL